MPLDDMHLLGDAERWNHPLVFLNSCHGAAHDVFFYDGFMSFFIEERGARAFVSTEISAPQLLAHKFALRFLQAFMQGQPVGEIL